MTARALASVVESKRSSRVLKDDFEVGIQLISSTTFHTQSVDDSTTPNFFAGTSVKAFSHLEELSLEIYRRRKFPGQSRAMIRLRSLRLFAWFWLDGLPVS